MPKNVASKRLKGLMAENDMTVSDLSNKMDLPEKILSEKINGCSEWLFCEMIFITKLFGFSEVKMVFPELYNSVLAGEAL